MGMGTGMVVVMGYRDNGDVVCVEKQWRKVWRWRWGWGCDGDGFEMVAYV